MLAGDFRFATDLGQAALQQKPEHLIIINSLSKQLFMEPFAKFRPYFFPNDLTVAFKWQKIH